MPEGKQEPAAARPAHSRRGTLFLVVGPSGVGKDSLISYCRARLADRGSILFPQRLITRAAADGSEDNKVISEEEFLAATTTGRFALSWRAHGLGYGIPVSIADDLAAGRSVVVNVSRSIIEDARRRFRPLVIISVESPPEIVAERLRRRSREVGEAIADRLARGRAFAVSGPDVARIDNSGALATAGDAIIELIASRAGLR